MDSLTDTVYVLGAGANKSLRSRESFSPPLINEFFQIALAMPQFSHEHYMKQMMPVFNYIQEYWKMSVQDLASRPFNLEDLFTLASTQFDDAQAANDINTARSLQEILQLSKAFLTELLSEFTYSTDYPGFQHLAKVIYDEKPTVLTFNYDCYLERAIESASEHNMTLPEKKPSGTRFDPCEITEEDLVYSFMNWNMPLGYGFKFDEVELRRPGVGSYVDGKRFYSHPGNNLYDWKILKLHGSLNWFQYLPFRAFPTMPGEEEPEFTSEMKNSIILKDELLRINDFPRHNGWYINPLIVTPELNKTQLLRRPLFSQIWQNARTALSNCRRLVVIGYSFSASDFPTRKLFLESFTNSELEEVVVVNPDTSIARTVKNLCHFDRPILTCENIHEYLRSVDPDGSEYWSTIERWRDSASKKSG